MATVNYLAADVKAARDWYRELLGVPPYFERPDSENPKYVEFRIGDYQAELGIIDRSFAPVSGGEGPSGAVLYWHVDDVDAILARLLAMGATELEPKTERGVGFVTVSVADPFGNILGLMYNAHYLEMLDAR
jgi:predicted enzyme related to lactoylglutathione lyase